MDIIAYANYFLTPSAISFWKFDGGNIEEWCVKSGKEALKVYLGQLGFLILAY